MSIFDRATALADMPHSAQAEQAVISAVLQNNRVYDDVCDILDAEHFFSAANGLIYGTAEKMILAGVEANPVSIRERLEGSPELKAIGGWDVIWPLIHKSLLGFLGNRTYAETIRNLWTARKLLVVSVETQERIRKPDGETAQDVLDSLEGELLTMSQTRADMRTASLSASMMEALTAAQEASQSEGLSGASTGYDEFDEITGGLEPGTITIIAGRPAMGKAQPLTVPVLLKTGEWKKIGELKIGDEIASIDGAPSVVTGIYPQGVKEVQKISFSDGRSVRACKEHLWQVKSSKFTKGDRVLSTQDISCLLGKVRYKGRLRLPEVNGLFGESGNLPICPWVLGALLGNGYLSKDKISFSTNDPDTLQKLKTYLGAENVRFSGAYDYYIMLSSKEGSALRKNLTEIGIIDCLSNEKFIPSQYLKASREERCELLRGLLDTDGWAEKWGSVRYCTTSKQLALDIQQLVWSIGGCCNISSKNPKFTYKNENKVGMTAFILNISHTNRSGLFSLGRKKERCEVKMSYKSPHFVSIEPDGMEECVCISVSHPSKLYVTSNFIVTHNTAAGLGIGIRSAKQTGKRTLYWSGEVSKKQMSQRAIASKTGIPLMCIRTGKNRGQQRLDGTYGPGTPLRQEQWDKLVAAQMEAQAIPMDIDDTPAISVPKLYGVARRMARSKQGLGLIVVDYLALMKGSKQAQRQGKYAEVSEISADLLAMAKNLNVPIVALQQLNRDVEKRENRRPLGSDLRDSGNLEQDASVIVLLYREEYYLQKDGAPTRKEGETDEKFYRRCDDYTNALANAAGKAVWIVDKNRQGECRDIQMQFNGPQTWFRGRTEDSDSPAW